MDTKHCLRSCSVPDATTQRYERALSELAIASLPLIFRDTTPKQLRHFIAAALELRDSCHEDNSPEHPLDVLLWLRRRLNQEAKNPRHGEFYRAQCLREVNRVEQQIELACVKLSQGGLTILE